MVNKKPVTSDPGQMYFHFTFTSGRILNINPKRMEIIQSDKMKLITLKITVVSFETFPSTHVPIEAIAVEIISETISKKAIDKINPNEKILALRFGRNP